METAARDSRRPVDHPAGKKRHRPAALLLLLFFVLPATLLSATGLRETVSPEELTVRVPLPDPPITLPSPVVRLALLAGEDLHGPLRLGAERAVRDINARAAAGAQVVLVRDGVLPDRSPRVLDLQINQVENALRREVAAIIIDPVDPVGIRPYLEDAARAGVPVITINNRIDSELVVLHVATDDRAATATLVDELVSLIGSPSVVAVLSGPGENSYNRIRRDGLTTRFRERHPGTRVLLPLPDGAATENEARDAVTNLLVTGADVRAVLTTDPRSTIGAARGVARSGRSGAVVVIGFERDSRLAEARLPEGSVQGYLEESPFTVGYVAVMRALDVLRGEDAAPFVAVPYRFVRTDFLF